VIQEFTQYFLQFHMKDINIISYQLEV